MSNKQFRLVSLTVMGVGFHEYKGKQHLLVAPLKGVLLAEPENTADEYAVLVMAREGTELKKAGYLPRGGNRMVSEMLRHGYEFEVHFRPDPTGVSPTVDVLMAVAEKGVEG